MGLETLMKLQGFRTTLSFILITVVAGIGMFVGKIPSQEFLDFMKWAFGIYAGARAIYKGTEVVAKNKNGNIE